MEHLKSIREMRQFCGKVQTSTSTFAHRYTHSYNLSATTKKEEREFKRSNVVSKQDKTDSLLLFVSKLTLPSKVGKR